MRAILLCKVHFPHLGFRNFLDETVKAFAFLPRVEHLLGCDDKCMLSAPLSANDFADGKVAESARCCPPGTSLFVLPRV